MANTAAAYLEKVQADFRNRGIEASGAALSCLTELSQHDPAWIPAARTALELFMAIVDVLQPGLRDSCTCHCPEHQAGGSDA